VLPDWHCEEIPCDLECHTFFDVLDEVAQVCHSALTCNETDPICSTITTYATVAEPSHPAGEYLGVWLYRLERRASATGQRTGLVMPAAQSFMTVGIKLMENGWPQIGDPEANSLPSFEAINAMAYHSTGHAERITRALWNALSTGALPSGCSFKDVGPVQPVAPSGGQVGWTWSVLLLVPW
jgi:hypothetical protein